MFSLSLSMVMLELIMNELMDELVFYKLIWN